MTQTHLRSAAPAAPASPARRSPPARGLIAAAAGLLGELLISFGVLVLLFAVYELKVTDYQAAGSQHRLQHQLTQEWNQPASTATARDGELIGVSARPAAGDGQGFAIIRIPRFGASYHRVVVEGVSSADLQLGPGHYPGTALPGQLGNAVISGHRTTYGHPFWAADTLRVRDSIEVQIRDRIYRYRVTARKQEPSMTRWAVSTGRPGRGLVACRSRTAWTFSQREHVLALQRGESSLPVVGSTSASAASRSSRIVRSRISPMPF